MNMGHRGKLFLVTSLLGLLTVPTLSLGHSLYIQSGRYAVDTKKESPLFFCFGHHFPVDEAVRGEKFSYIRVIEPDKATNDIKVRDEKSLHSYMVSYDKPGTYILTAETNPGYFVLYTDLKDRKRHSLKPLNAFVDNAKSVETSMRSSQWAKTWVVSGTPSDEFPAVAGLPLEIVPTKDITQAKEGDSIRFVIYQNGKRYMGDGSWDATYGGFSTASEDLLHPRTEIENGEFSITLEQGGRWFVRFFTKIAAEGKDKELFMQDKQTATITFMVENERKRPKPKHS